MRRGLLAVLLLAAIPGRCFAFDADALAAGGMPLYPAAPEAACRQ